MTLLQRYIFKIVTLATVMVVVAMLGLTFVIGLLTELRDVGSQDYGFLQAVIHVVLELPHTLYEFFPMLMLLGGVIGLGILSSNQELVVMRASGFSSFKIMKASILAAVLLILVATVVGEVLAPKGFYMAESRKESEQNGGQSVATAKGVWVHEGNNFIHIQRVVGLHHLEGVTRYEFNARHELLASYYVKAMDMENGNWLLHDVSLTRFLPNQTRSQQLPVARWNLVLNPNLLTVGVMDPAEMPLGQLHRYAERLSRNGLRAANFDWEFWKRIFQPLNSLLMLLLAIPFVLRTSRTTTMGVRVLFGAGVGFVFYSLNAFLGQFSVVFQVQPLWAALVPTGLFVIVVLVYGYVRGGFMVLMHGLRHNLKK